MTVVKPSIIQGKVISWNLAKWGGRKIAPAPEYVVVHYTGSMVESVNVTYDVLKQRGANCHYIVASKGIYECVDPEKYACMYACAAKYATDALKMFTGTQTATHIKLAGNYNTINLECCSEKRTRKCAYATAAAAHDWYFSDKTYRNMVQAVSWLLDKFGLGLDRLIMHHHISGKLCPAMWCNREEAYKGWAAFKDDVATVLNKATTAQELPPPTGPGSYLSVFAEGTIHVNEGDNVYYTPAPDAIIIGYVPQTGDIPYTYAANGYFYTKYGYIRGGQ